MQTKKGNKSLLFLFVATIYLFVFAVPAFAVDPFVYPGSNCVRYGGSSSTLYSFSAIGNASGTLAMYLDCPAVYDHTGNLDGAWFRVNDRIAGSDSVTNNRIQCSVVNAYINSVGNWVARSRFNYSRGSGTQTVPLSGFPTVHSVESHVYLSCRIPPRQFNQTNWIATYSVDP